MSSFTTISQQDVCLSSAQPVRVSSHTVENDISKHGHEYAEIFVVEKGTTRHTSDVKDSRLRKGDVVFIPRGLTHAFLAPDELQVINICYLAEWFLGDMPVPWRQEGLVPLFFASTLFRHTDAQHVADFSLTEEELAQCLYELRAIENEHRNCDSSALLIRGAFAKFLVVLSRAWQRQMPARHQLNFRKEVWAALEAIDADIREGRLFSVETFARRAGLAPDTFYRIFRTATGLAPMEYFQARRVQHAGNLLLRSELSVSEIAHELGYADGAHLTRFFRKHLNVSPSEYRKIYRTSDVR